MEHMLFIVKNVLERSNVLEHLVPGLLHLRVKCISKYMYSKALAAISNYLLFKQNYGKCLQLYVCFMI